jgi:hypothetical protein
MKKLLTAIVLFVFVALPMSVMAMTTIADNDLSTVTGQSGVSIGADVTMNITADVIAWGDSDGIGGATTAGWVGLSALNINTMRIHMRGDNGMIDPLVAFGMYQLFGGAGTQAAFLADISGPTPTLLEQKALMASILGTQGFLTIDTYTAGSKTYVRIGIPTFEIDIASLNASVGLWSDNAGKPGTYQEMGTISMINMVALLGKGNYVDISQNDTASGVLINVANKTTAGNMIDKLTIASMSWGDADGLMIPGFTKTPGYVGLTNFEMDAVKVAATININVCTPTGQGVTGAAGLVAMDAATFGGFVAALPTLLASNDAATKDTIAYILNKAGVIGTTSVDIQLQANINIGKMFATVALGKDAALSNAPALQNVLGQFYIGNMNIAIPAYAAGVNAASWVTISAH